jgi:hypothetical protein
MPPQVASRSPFHCFAASSSADVGTMVHNAADVMRMLDSEIVIRGTTEQVWTVLTDFRRYHLRGVGGHQARSATHCTDSSARCACHDITLGFTGSRATVTSSSFQDCMTASMPFASRRRVTAFCFAKRAIPGAARAGHPDRNLGAHTAGFRSDEPRARGAGGKALGRS